MPERTQRSPNHTRILIWGIFAIVMLVIGLTQ